MVGQVLIIRELKQDDIVFYDSYEAFLKDHEGHGILKIRVFAGNGIIPLKDVHISISKVIGKEKIIFFEGYTNDSGVVNEIELPAPKINQQNPKSATYLVESSHHSYIKKEPSLAFIYDGIKSILEMEMLPREVEM